MASFLSVPVVVRIKVLSYLTLKDQLILRQVCTTTNDWIDTSSLPYHAPVTLIKDHGAKTFTRFFERRPPHIITSVYLKNNSQDFLKDPALPCFLQNYSPAITSLRMQRFFPCNTSKDISFFEGFTCLSNLELDKISIPSESEVVYLFPNNFKHLKTLKIGSVKAYPEPPDDTFGATLIPLDRQRPMGVYAWKLIAFCEKIEFLGYPQTAKYFFQAFIDGRGRREFGVFCDYIRDRHLRFPNSPKLTVDLQNDSWDPDTKNALPLLKLGSEFGIKFLNLNSNLFQFVKIDSLIKMYDLSHSAGDCILSFKHFNCLITKCLPSVNKIYMSASQVNTMLDYSCVFNGPKTFPSLEEIEIIIDVGFSSPECDIYHRAREFRDVLNLLSHFFYDTEMILSAEQENALKHVRVYENVHTLTIKFADLAMNTVKKANPEDLPLEWISKSLPNVRKLKLQGWDTQNQQTYCSFLESFPKLEEFILDDYENLEGRCFYKCGQNLVRIAVKSKNAQNCSIDEAICNLNLHPSIFLNKSSKHQKATWCK